METYEYACDKPTRLNPNGRRGTRNGYHAHRKAGEPPCEECRLAWNERQRKVQADLWRTDPRHRARHRLYQRPRTRRAPSQSYSPKDISETHGETCYLCGRKVNFDVEPPTEPTAADIDHVISLHQHHGPGDVLSNVRWVHRRCKERRGKRQLGQLGLPFPNPEWKSFHTRKKRI